MEDRDIEQDPANYLSAGELRAFGVPIPESIPDCAWIPRDSIEFAMGKASSVSADGTITLDMQVKFHAPMQWVQLTIETGQEEPGGQDG